MFSSSLSLDSNSVILSQLQAFVKNFFQDFSTFFEALNKALCRDPLRFRSSFRIISHSNPLVKNFFRLFSNFFDRFQPEAHRSAQLVQSTTSSALCQDLFSSFFKLSFGLSKFASDRYSVRHRFRSNLNILAHPRPFVKTHFSILLIDL